jgi:hypothetical protein
MKKLKRYNFYHKAIIMLFLLLLTYGINAQTRLVANGFWLKSGTNASPASLTDNGNVIYHFTATSDGTVIVKLSTIDPGIKSSFYPEMVYDANDVDAFLQLYEGTSEIDYGDDDPTSPHEHNALITHAIQNGHSYSIVATTLNPGMIGAFFIDVTGPISAPPLSFVTPLTFMHANGTGTSIEQDRAVCLYTNTDLCPFPGPTVTWKKDGNDLCITYPFPYYFITSQNNIGQYSAKISYGGSNYECPPVTVSMLPPTTPRNTWEQKEFVIADWYDPLLTEVSTDDDLRIKDWRDAGFTLLYGTGTGSGNTKPLYVVERTAAANNSSNQSTIGCLINDGTINNGNSSKTFNATTISNRLNLYSSSSLTLAQRNAFMGYFISDEPHPFGYSSDLSTLELVGSTDLNKLAVLNLNGPEGGWVFHTYHVRAYVNSPWAKVLTSTDYPFNTESSTGYSDQIHFKRLSLYANEIKASGYNVNFWGLTNCCEQLWPGMGHNPLPSAAMMRYNAFGPVTYGAKGIFWYVYNHSGSAVFPHSATNNGVIDHSVYDNLATVNGELKQIGPVLMKLKWIGTFHGSATDPSSQETGLQNTYISPVYSLTPAANVNSSVWKKDSLCIGIHTDGNDDYLMVFNKSMYQTAPLSSAYSGYTNSSRITTEGITEYKYPLQFNKTTGKWEILHIETKDNENKRIGFDVTTSPGEMQLIWLAPGNKIPLVDLNLDLIGQKATAIAADPNFDATEITLYGGYSLIGTTSDDVIFANKKVKGGIIVDTKLDDAKGHGGIMIRQSLDPNSPVVFLCNNNISSATVYYRGTQGAEGQWLPSTATQPVYLRLIRFGNTIRALVSSDAINYTEAAKVSFPTGEIYVGLCTEGYWPPPNRATFSNFKIRPYDPLTPIVNLLLND